jgi:two-component system sensor histidine kinase CpxA
MKVSYPLSLKVSLWLMLNLLLLAALGLGFVVVQGGLGWSALIAGSTGERAQSLFNVIAGEAAAATGEARDEVLKRFGAAYGAEFFLFGPGEIRLVGGARELPAEVRERVELRGPWGLPGRSAGPARDGLHDSDREAERARRREWAEKSLREGAEKTAFAPGEKTRFVPEGRGRGEPGFTGPPLDWRPGRFIARTSTPPGYWIGLRVPFAAAERSGRPSPALLLARVNSLWSLFHLIGLQSWLLAGSAVLALSVLFWLPLVHSITRSLGQLTKATEQIAEGRFETRVDTRRRDELGRLGESVNRMATRLDAHMTGQKRFLGDVAHELCSPLARLQMATGILAEQAPPALQNTVGDVREEVQQMSTLVNELLAFTKAGMQPRDVALTAVELEPLARAVLAREGAAARVTLSIAPGLCAQVDADLLGRALGNLIRNAVRYAGDAGAITLSASREGNRVILLVDDEGPGVPAADVDRLGEPFFRPEFARTRESGGVGLGLAIVRNSVAACQGEVRFSNRTPRGFRAEVRLVAT